jgi:hypothetical protein
MSVKRNVTVPDGELEPGIVTIRRPSLGSEGMTLANPPASGIEQV